jgi:sensor histidine kinase regulating citrate/malate metabolism
MRLITKINIYFGIILIILMVSVFLFTHHFIQKELQAQMESSLRITYESFKLTIDYLIKEQKTRATIQTKRDIIGLTTADRLTLVLHYYLNLAANDYNLNLIEVLDPDGNLLADNSQAYEKPLIKVNFKKPAPNSTQSYLSQRNQRIYLITTTPIVFADKLAGYLNLGTLVDNNLVDYFSSVLHSKLLFYADHHFLVGNTKPFALPDSILEFLRAKPDQDIFLPGNKIGVNDFDYIFFAIPSDANFTGIIAIANSRSEVLAALLRLKIFLLTLSGFCLLFGFIGANQLARNIKKSIFGMEPKEIASLLDQRTTILQSTFEGIIALDQEGLITLINNEAKRILPSDLEMVGQPAWSFFGDLNFTEVLTTGQAVYSQQQVIGETVIVYNCVPIKTKTGILGAVITLRDLTEFQKVAEELVEVKNYTQALRAQSHEFMNKLQSVSGLIQLGRYETALTLLHETTESHQDLITFLTNAFSISAVSGILLGKFNRAKELNIQFEIDRASFIPTGETVPDNELVCIVGNLIENAFEALQESRPAPKKVWVKIYPRHHSLRVAVIDNGPGIPRANQKQIFERGFTTKKGQNKGIGLSLVKQHVENLRGSIKIRCGNQTVFLIKIPLKNGGHHHDNQSINR